MNPFQAQYPLSPKKFWKKFISSIASSILSSVVIAALSTLYFVFQTSGANALGTIITSVIQVGIAAFILLLVLHILYIIVYIKSYYYQDNNDFITIRKNVFTPREINLQYQRIQDVYVDQDLLDRVMGLYDVHIETATFASGQASHIDGVNKEIANGLKNFFLQKIQSSGVQK